MDNNQIESLEILDRVIVGRVEPHIYAFTTNTVPNYLKVGDTYRPVTKRLAEWREFFPELKKKYENKAIINDEIYFRDYAIHQYLEKDIHKKRLSKEELGEDIYYSREFFKETTAGDIDNAIEDIKNNYHNNTHKYEYYSSQDRLPQIYHYERADVWSLRPNQKIVVDNFVNAIKNGRKNLLMYAVMRFGKSFTSLCCALKIEANIVLIVSAKADVKEEWKKTVESAGNFIEYSFLETSDLLSSESAINDMLSKGRKVVIFLTLQDLQGDNLKDKHKELFSKQIDLLIVDETHFGARAESFGKVLKGQGYYKADEKNIKQLDDENIDAIEADKEIKKINTKVRLHLSGTPYRILMGSEFEKEDIISFVQFTDIVREQEGWDMENLTRDEVNEWDNPYYGFPQMVRFAFNPNKSSRVKMEKLNRAGISFTFSKLFEPESIKKVAANKHKKFINENEILDLLKVIDGSKSDEEILGFLDYDKIKEGNMCRHMVMVLPYCASCDAMEELLKVNREEFKNLDGYAIINISGLEAAKEYKKPIDIKNKIRECESQNQKTLTLTVNRMLTGSTVEEWDTMLYFKDTASPQEYDQSIFRLQNQYIRTLSSDTGVIKENLKPQTLLIDFDPVRLFRMQEQKSLIYNVNVDENGNSKLKERIDDEIRISPIIVMNKNKIREVNATNILEVVGEYNNQRSVSEEVMDIPIDLSILNDEAVRKTIEIQAEFNSKKGLTIDPNQGEDDDLDIEDAPDIKKTNKEDSKEKDYSETKTDNELKKLENQIRTYYQRILFFSFLTKDKVSSMDQILTVIDREENSRIAKNLFLEKEILQKLTKYIDPLKMTPLDYKIQNISKLASDGTIEPLKRAMTSIRKFNRMSESEVIASPRVCDEMVSLLPEGELRKIVSNQEKLLDIASTAGEYSVSLYKRLVSEMGYSHDVVKDSIFSIPTSSIAYEFTRKFYEILNLNVENISVQFNAYDLIEEMNETGEVDYSKLSRLIKQEKPFNQIALNDEIGVGENKVKFGAVIGNPPYQLKDGGAQASSKPIYQHFVLLGEEVSSRYSCFITPTRWFAGGKGLDEFRKYMFDNKSMKELHDFLTPEDVFPDTNNRGGVCYFINDKKKTESKVRVITHQNDKVISDIERDLLVDGINIFIRDSIAISIIKKVFQSNFDYNLSTIVSSRKPFGLESNIIKSDIFHPNASDLSNPVLCIGKNMIRGYIERENVKSHQEWIDKWKVYVPRANNIGTELSDDNLNSFVGEPNSICTESYIAVGANYDLDEQAAINLAKYLTTKFVRFLHRQAKASHDATSKTYRFIPIPDFTNESIGWGKSIDEIDEDLFNQYELSSEEINHIKSSIKDM